MKPYKDSLDKVSQLHPNGLDPLNILEHKDGMLDEVLYYGNQPNNKVKLFAAISAYADNFCFNYDYLKKYLEYYNEYGLKDKIKKFPFNIPTEIEFLKVLEFRESEMKRVLLGGEETWLWPMEWGDIGWNQPVFHNDLRNWDFMGELDKTQSEKILDRTDHKFALEELRQTQRGIWVHQSKMGMDKTTIFL